MTGVAYVFVPNDNAIEELTGSPEFINEMARTGQRIVNRAKVLCPVDTGRLRSSINWQIIRTNSEERPVALLVGSNVNYAGYVELGTRYMTARHYLLEALLQESNR